MASTTNAIPLLTRVSRLIRPTFRAIALFLRREAGRRRMEEPPTLRQARAAERFEAWHGDWATAVKGLIPDILWNLAFVLVAVAGLAVSWEETPVAPLRFWVAGFVVQCLLHVAAIFVAYWSRITEGWRRRRRGEVDIEDSGSLQGADEAHVK